MSNHAACGIQYNDNVLTKDKFLSMIYLNEGMHQLSAEYMEERK